ncbi:MAG: hypothetical protein RIS26_1064 [Actinomycetota bacterium]|jgi:biotin transport system ATP-binding protein
MSLGIKLQGVTVDFGGHLALSGVNLDLSARSTAVVGVNGSGKSTLARLLNGLVKPSAGTVSVAGSEPSTEHAGFLFSNPDLQIVMPTVYEDVAFSLKGLGLSEPEVAKRVSEALGAVGIEQLATSNCYELSSGQKQLLAIAAIMVRAPKLLIADEPTTLLDLPNTKRVSQLLHSLALEQLVVVTHDLELASTFDEVVWFHEGKVRSIGAPEKVTKEYREFFE